MLIVSTGGVATTTLINYLKLYKKVNDENDDGYKHLNKFPLIGKKELKILYIYGNYEKIYNSLKKKRYFSFQMVKLGYPFVIYFEVY